MAYTAIFTFTSEEELAAFLTDHPVRGVKDGDMALVCGGNSGDDILVYQAVLLPKATPSASPSEGTPSSSPSEGTPSPSDATPSDTPSEGTPSITPSDSPSESTPSDSPSSSPSEGTPSPSDTPSHGTPSDSPSASPSEATPSSSSTIADVQYLFTVDSETGYGTNSIRTQNDISAAGVSSPVAEVRLWYPPRNTNISWSAHAVWIGKKGTGGLDFDGTQVEVLQGSTSGFTSGTAGSWSDWVSINLAASDILIVSIGSSTSYTVPKDQPHSAGPVMNLAGGGTYANVSTTTWTGLTSWTGGPAIGFEFSYA